MKKRLYEKISFITIVTTFLCTCITMVSCFTSSNKMAASSDDVIRYCDQGVNSYFKKKYSNIISVREDTSEKTLVYFVENYDQTRLNNYYNSKVSNENDKITGTCTIVACLSMITYYSYELEEFEISESNEECFIKIYNACLNAGYTTRVKGTSMSKVNNCLTKSFKTYGSKHEGNTEWFRIYKKTKKKIENDKLPLIFDLTNHSTVACGFTTYNVTYKDSSNNTITASEEFVIVNEGWGYDTKSLVPTSKISNATKSMQICFAE